MQGVDNSILNVALPHIQGSLSASLDQVAWALTSYIVCAAIMMPADRLARRPLRHQVHFFGLGHRFYARLGAVRRRRERRRARFLSRAAGGGGGRYGPAVAGDAVADPNPPERHGRAMAVFGMGTICGPIMGPALGGWLTYEYSWRWASTSTCRSACCVRWASSFSCARPAICIANHSISSGL